MIDIISPILVSPFFSLSETTPPIVVPGGTIADVPLSVTVVFPRADYHSVNTSIRMNSGIRVENHWAVIVLGSGHDGTQIIHSTAIANFNGGSIPANVVQLQTLSTRIATDWYAWRKASLEIRYESAVPWVSDGMHDVEYQHSSIIATAVHRSEWEPEHGQLQHAGQFGSSAEPPICGTQGVKVVTGELVDGKFDGRLQLRDNSTEADSDATPIWIYDWEGAAELSPNEQHNGTFRGLEPGGISQEVRAVYSIRSEGIPETRDPFFPAQIIGSGQQGDDYVYDWIEQTIDADGAYINMAGGRSGTAVSGPFLYEMNNNYIAPITFVRAFFRGIVDGQPIYDFDRCCDDEPIPVLFGSVGTLVLFGYTPTITLLGTYYDIVPQRGTLVLLGYTPTITLPNTYYYVAPLTGTLVLFGYTPTIWDTVYPDAGNLYLIASEGVPVIGTTVDVILGNLILFGYTPSITIDGSYYSTAVYENGVLVLFGYTPTITLPNTYYSVTPESLKTTFILYGHTPTITLPVIYYSFLVDTNGTLILLGYTPIIITPRAIVSTVTLPPVVVTTSDLHELTTGNNVTILGCTNNTGANGTWNITVVDADRFSLDGAFGTSPFGGTEASATWIKN